MGAGGPSAAAYTFDPNGWHSFQAVSNPVSSAFTYAHPASVYSSSGHQSTDADWLASEPGPHSYSTPGLYAMQELPVPEPGGQGYDTTPHNASLVGHYGSTSPSAFQSGSVSSPSMDTNMGPASAAAAAADQQRTKASRKSSSSTAKKPKQEYPISPASASSGGAKPRAKKANLRTASRTSKNTHHNPPATEEERKSRESHNQVEKNYRERLNGHFKSLLDVLPEDLRSRLDDDDDGGGGGGGGASERHSSKAEVLVMAKQYIRELEEKLARREEGREAERDVETVRWFCAECEKQKSNHGW